MISWCQSPRSGDAPYLREVFELPGGPSANAVNCIVQGPQGFLWFGGHGGLIRYDGYRFKTYKAIRDDSTSLEFSYVEYLHWTHDDYLWVATYGGGLFRFDPRDETFVRYVHDPENPTSLNNDYVTYLLEDRNNTLWVGTVLGLNRMDHRATGQFTRFEHEDTDAHSLSHPNVRCIYEDRAGALWIGTGFVYADDPELRTQGGLNRFHPETGTFTRYLHDPEDPTTISGNPVKSIYEDTHGTFWIGCTGGLNIMDRIQGTFELMHDDPLVDHDIFAPGIIDGEPSIVHSIVEDQSGGLWIFTLHVTGFIGSAARIDLQSGHMKIIWEREEFAPWHTMQATDGSLWIAGAGVSNQVEKISRNASLMQYYPASLGLEQRTLGVAYDGLAFSGDSVVWAKYHSAVDGSLVLRKFTGMSMGRWRDTAFPDFMLTAPDNIEISYTTEGQNPGPREGTGLVIDPLGKIWGCTGDREGGIFRFDPVLNTITQFLHDPDRTDSPPGNRIFSLMTDSAGYIWMGGVDAVSRLDPVRETYVHYSHHPQQDNTLSPGPKVVLFADREGFIWAGGSTGSRGNPIIDNPTLNRLDPVSGHVDRIYFPHPLHGTPVTAITQNPAGDILFVMLGRGLAVVFGWHLQQASGNVENWSSSFGGRLFDNVNNIITDAQGIHWLTHDINLAPDNHVLRFNSESGLAAEFEVQPDLQFYPRRAFADPHGNLMFHHQGGLMALHASGLIPTHDGLQKPSVHFTDLLLNGQIVTPGDNPYLDAPIGQSDMLHFPASLNSFGITFSMMDFGNTANCRYDVRLLPAQKAWRRIEGEPLVNYFELPPGTYTLEVRGSNGNGVWSEQPTALQIHLSPPWWKSPLALIIYALTLVLGIWATIRRRIRMQRQRQAIRQQEAEAHRLKELEALKSTLYTNITHEFRTPLTTILGMARKMDEQPETWFREGITMIRRNGAYLLNLVNQMLDLQKLESGKMVVHLQHDDLIHHLRYLVESFHALAESKGIQIHFLPGEQTLLMDFDPEKIQQIISNLLSNALKFTPPGGHVYLSVETISAGAEDHLRIRVRDTGSGIPEAHHMRIFDRFYQVEADINKKSPGSGVGLSLVRQLVALLDGKVEVESEIGKGSIFTITLPIISDPNTVRGAQIIAADATVQAFVPAVMHTEEEPGPESGEGLPVCLIIEDDADVRRYLQACLHLDYRLHLTGNGTAGIEEALRTIPDVIICDVMMPETDGFEVCAALKYDMRTCHIPIVLLTARSDMPSRIKGLHQGADAYLMKPFHEEELKTRLTGLIALRTRMQAKYSVLAAGTTTEQVHHTPDERFMLRLKALIEAHLEDEHFGITELCAELSISRMQLHRKLKALTNLSASHFIRNLRLARARELLHTTELSVSEIAYRVGFRNPSYFTESFVNHFGLTPTESRKA